VVKPNYIHKWCKPDDAYVYDGQICRVFRVGSLQEAIDKHSNFFDDFSLSWFQEKTPRGYKLVLQNIIKRSFQTRNFDDGKKPNLVERISDCEDLDEQCDEVTRISIIRSSVLCSDTKRSLLEFLLNYTDKELAFLKVQKIYICKLDGDADWTVIEWFFMKGFNLLYRKILGRTLIHIAHTLWKQYNKVILYPDAVQKFGGRRSIDIQTENST